MFRIRSSLVFSETGVFYVHAVHIVLNQINIESQRQRWYNSYTRMRFNFDVKKSKRLRSNPKRGIGFEEAQRLFEHPYYLDQRSDLPEQYRVIGWVGERLYAVIFEVREDKHGEYYHLVTLWKATKQEQQLYEENS